MPDKFSIKSVLWGCRSLGTRAIHTAHCTLHPPWFTALPTHPLLSWFCFFFRSLLESVIIHFSLITQWKAIRTFYSRLVLRDPMSMCVDTWWWKIWGWCGEEKAKRGDFSNTELLETLWEKPRFGHLENQKVKCPFLIHKKSLHRSEFLLHQSSRRQGGKTKKNMA